MPLFRSRLADAFCGIVSALAVQQTGDRDDGFVLLGLEPPLKHRDHHRALRRERDIDPELRAQLDTDDEL